MPPKPKPKQRPPPANFAALRRYAHVSHSAAHSHSPYSADVSRADVSRADQLAQQTAYDAQLTAAILDVRRKIMDSEMALSTLPDSPLVIPTAPLQKLRKLQALKVAHDRGFHTLDYVPDADSPLNTLLAFRRVQAVITQTNASIQDVEARIRSAQTLLKSSTAAGSEQDRLKAALGARLATLEDAERQIDVGASIGSQGDLVRKMRAKRKEVMRRTARLLGELLYFLDAGLARMVAAEQMGGPVVGDDVDVTLATGFDKKGNVKKGNRRIDEMWGQGDEDPEKRMVLEFKDLLEELMSASLENSPYIELKKDSAAARFLVRAKVAVFHPKDAQRMKLVDFGSNVEDG